MAHVSHYITHFTKARRPWQLLSSFFSISIYLFILSIYLGSCSQNSKLVKKEINSPELKLLITKADSTYSISPRSSNTVQKAYQLMSQVIEQISNSHPMRFEYLCKTARFANWLAYNGNEKMEISKLASEAMSLSKKAILVDKDRVEGYYFRAIATGLFAEQNKIQSKDAMKSIRNDALKAISIDPAFAQGGPHRLLGALYLRAPGPPAGIGSTRKALQHLEEACRIAPDYPENLVFLAEIYIKANKQEKAKKLIQQVLSSYSQDGDFMDRQKWRERALELQRLMAKSN